MAIARAGFLCFLALSWHSPAVWAADEHFAELRRLDEQVEAIKQQALALDQDFKQLEDAELFPPTQQLRVFLTMEVFDFDLATVALSANGQELTDHIYTPREIYALRKGGVQDLHLGNISPGIHKMQARFTGRFEDSDATYEKSVEVSFRKSREPLWLELRIDRSTGKQLNVRIFQREVAP